MSNKTKKKIIISALGIFFILHNFFAVKTIHSDFYFDPQWTISLPNELQNSRDSLNTENILENLENIEGFFIDNTYGYFLPDGTLISSTPTDNYLTISTFGFVEYKKDATEFIVYNPNKEILCTISDIGFAHLVHDKVYIFHPGGDSVSLYSLEGEKLWKKEHIAPITAFNSIERATVLGYADGKLLCIDLNGNELVSFYPGGSDYPIILGAALSSDASMLACVSGINPQRFILIKIEKGQFKVVMHQYLEKNSRRQLYVSFNNSGNYLFFETEDQLGFVNCKNYTLNFSPIKGKIISAGQNSLDSLLVVLSKDHNSFVLAAYETPNYLLASSNIYAQEAFLIQQKDSLYLGTDSSISKINIRGLK